MNARQMIRGSRLALATALGLGLLASSGCKKGGDWLVGNWLLLDPDGKPGVCHEFKKDRSFSVYTSSECGGEPDQTSSGKWEEKEDGKLAMIRFNERKAQLVMVTERDAEHFVARGALAGTLYRVGEKGAAPLLAKLEASGAIKVKPLQPTWGCQQLLVPLGQLRALPKETEPRMLRQKDQGLEYVTGKSPGDSKIEKVVYALNGEAVEWVALHLSEEAFNPPGPQARLEETIGKPQEAIGTGAGEKRQHIVMWKAYCAGSGSDGVKKDVDVTLFSTAGAKRATVYVSEGVVASLWEDLKQIAANPAAQATDEDEEGDEKKPEEKKQAKAEAKAEKKPEAKAEKKPEAKAPAAKPEPKPESKKAAKPADDDDI
jgi:hypothetical protein